ncbi:hypothetical protein ACO0QE_003438 [Hanseniaspora vineae]
MSTEDQKKNALLEERRAKLAAWKKQREKKLAQQQETAQQPPLNVERPQQSVTSITLEKKTDKRKLKRKKKITFNENDEPTLKPTEHEKVEPSIKNDHLLLSNNEDPLDAFMSTLSPINDQLHTKERFLLSSDSESIPSNESSEGGESTGAFKQSLRKKKKKRKIVSRLRDSDLVPFEKNFYHEPEELKNMTDEEVADLRLSLDNICVEGSGVIPKPITKWSYLGLSSDIMNVITLDLNFSTPTPIQAQAIPCIMSGRDVLGISKTGSGKTVTYLLPLLRQIKQQPKLKKTETGPIGLILSPTRELAFQIYEEVLKFTPPEVTSLVCTGGGELKEQISTIKKGVHIVVATPGRFIDLVTVNSGNLLKTNRISMVILDESDRLFDMGFGPQVRNIMRGIRKDRQCVLFSATFPESVQKFATMFLDDPVSITINSRDVVNENIHQKCSVFSDQRAKFEGLLKILDSSSNASSKTVIFLSSQEHCDALFEHLLNEGLDSEYKLFAIHAGKSSAERMDGLQEFKVTKNKALLLGTEILSRGLNVPEIELVIIYDAIKAFPQYVHSIGRTARTSSSTGVAHTLLLDDDCDLAASYVLFKSMRQHELDEMVPSELAALTAMYKKFDAGLKTGKYKIILGLGGKGLDNMSASLANTMKKAKSKYAAEVGSGDEEEATDNESGDDNVQRFEYKVDPVYDGEKPVSYKCQIVINDYPQTVRWEMTKQTTLMEVKRETGTSTTTKGKFYANNGGPLFSGDEPKLYLLLENKTEEDLKSALDIIQKACTHGYKLLESNESKKFSI